MKTWLGSLGSADLKALTESMASELGVQRPDIPAAVGFFGEQEPNVIELPEPPDQPVLLTVHLSLDDTEPQVWRRFSILGDLDLEQVHDVTQAAMGGTDSHLHRFHVGDAWTGAHFMTESDLDEGDAGTPETEARLDQLLRVPGDELGYTYDFGDGWNHTLRLESVVVVTPNAEASDPASPAVCLDGAVACPPEDVGGIPGYEELAEWVRHDYESAHAPPGRDAADLSELRSWLPGGWHPDEFSSEERNRDLARLATGGDGAVLAQLPQELTGYFSGVTRSSRFDVEPGWPFPTGATQTRSTSTPRVL